MQINEISTTTIIIVISILTMTSGDSVVFAQTDLGNVTLMNMTFMNSSRVQAQVGSSGVELPQQQQRPIPPAPAAISPGENKGLQLQDLPGLIKSTTLKGNETFWTNIVKYNFTKERDVNYVEAKLRVLGQNQTEQNHAGIVFWITDSNNNSKSKGYYAFLRPDKLAVYTDDRGEIQSPQDISRENGKWFTLKVVYMNNTINLFLNGKLQMQVPYIPSGGNTSAYISKVGIQSYNGVAEFEPIEIGTVNITKATAYEDDS